MITLGIVHTSFVLVDLLNDLTKRMLSEVNIVNIVDDTLLSYARRNGVDSKLTRRMCLCFLLAVEAGANIILNACSSVGETVEIARKIIDVPIIRIDEPMAEKAITIGKRIAVIATVESTLSPTLNLINSKAREKATQIEVTPFLVEGAFDLLATGKVEEHNNLVRDKVIKVAHEHDVIVFAQASMSKLASLLEQEIPIPILTSPVLAMEHIKKNYLKG